jgi:hypothetical protein
VDAVYDFRQIFLVVEVGQFENERVRKALFPDEVEEDVDIIGVAEIEFGRLFSEM